MGGVFICGVGGLVNLCAVSGVRWASGTNSAKVIGDGLPGTLIDRSFWSDTSSLTLST